ncbi:MAG: KamA family radical SAM protein, partial [Verrucomicrobiaceae bacterium]
MFTDTAHVDPPLSTTLTQAAAAFPGSEAAASMLAHRHLRRDEFWRGIPAYEDVAEAEFRTHHFQQKHAVT